MASACLSNCTTASATSMMARSAGSYLESAWTARELWQSWDSAGLYFEYHPWLFSMLGSVIVGLSGIFPLLVIRIDETDTLKQGAGSKTLKLLLSFAVGGLLGDVFLHILPEAWANHIEANNEQINGRVHNHATMGCGLWVLMGFLVFVIAEMIFSGPEKKDIETPTENKNEKKLVDTLENNNYERVEAFKNGFANNVVQKTNGAICNEAEIERAAKCLRKLSNGFVNGHVNGIIQSNGVKPTSNGFCALKDSAKFYDKQIYEHKLDNEQTKDRPKHIAGYLNLMANCVDNFTHGLAVGGSFLVSFRIGALTTFAILIHEIPHEIGDFAILLRSGFSRWDAAKAQLLTATGGMCGAFVAVIFSGDEVESKTSWILPFTAGSFLHIGLVSVLPELLSETNPWESLKQFGALLMGIAVMAFMTVICE
ncbi:zinc transporter ZIP13 homolog [Copidosoma floridanum]|uniref:zinc transporter ZIP13 homolog n=1 Tax=Copidosoma floridanum TaxID=29053 RepID=UPI0006C9DE24|nr:zinc transporter ZIP13 homolog [Copidosoma floridanum]